MECPLILYSIFLSLVMDSSRFRVSVFRVLRIQDHRVGKWRQLYFFLSRSVPTRHYSVLQFLWQFPRCHLCSGLLHSLLPDSPTFLCKAHLLSALSQDICTWYTFFLNILHPDLSWLPLPPFSSFTSQIEKPSLQSDLPPGHPGSPRSP